MSSEKAGYLLPSSTVPLPRQLTLDQFIQGILVGLSEIPGPLVRPKFQQAPPLNPDINTDWISFGVAKSDPDTYGYVGMDDAGNTHYQRHETLEVACGFHGPNALDTAILVRDGFQIQQNLQALESGHMGFTNVSAAFRIPELVNERWFDRYEMSIFFRRETLRTYPIVSILSANGTIYALGGNEVWLSDWNTGV